MLVIGLALAPFDVLAGGKLRTEAEAQARIAAGDNGRVAFPNEKLEASEEAKKVSAALEKVAAEVGAKSVQAGMSCRHPYAPHSPLHHCCLTYRADQYIVNYISGHCLPSAENSLRLPSHRNPQNREPIQEH